MAKELNKVEQKREIFAREYVIDRNATKAYKAAYGANVSDASAAAAASRLLKNVKTQAIIERLDAERMERLEITSDYVLEVVRDTVERCRALQPVTDKAGRPVILKTEKTADGTTINTFAVCAFEPAYVLKGAELLGKYKKLWSDRPELSLLFSNEMSVEELKQYAETGEIPPRLKNRIPQEGKSCTM